MPDERDSIYVDPTLPLADSFQNLPASFKSFLKGAFSNIARIVGAGRLAELMAVTSSEELSNGPPLSRSAASAAATRLGVGVEDVPGLFAASTFCVGILISLEKTTSDEFVDVGVKSGLIAAADKVAVHQFTEAIVSNRSPISDATKRHKLVQALLPSLVSFSCLVELRPSFTDDGSAINFSVPVVLAHLVNDSTDDVWIQMSKGQVERLIADMQVVLRKISVLETWAAKKENR